MAFGSFQDQGGAATPQPMSEINTTPLVDVMLVLLIIFIVTRTAADPRHQDRPAEGVEFGEP